MEPMGWILIDNCPTRFFFYMKIQSIFGKISREHTND